MVGAIRCGLAYQALYQEHEPHPCKECWVVRSVQTAYLLEVHPHCGETWWFEQYPYQTRSRQCRVFLVPRILHLWVYLLRHQRHKQTRYQWSSVFSQDQILQLTYQGNVLQHLLWQCSNQTCHQAYPSLDRLPLYEEDRGLQRYRSIDRRWLFEGEPQQRKSQHHLKDQEGHVCLRRFHGFFWSAYQWSCPWSSHL